MTRDEAAAAVLAAARVAGPAAGYRAFIDAERQHGGLLPFLRAAAETDEDRLAVTYCEDMSSLLAERKARPGPDWTWRGRRVDLAKLLGGQ